MNFKRIKRVTEKKEVKEKIIHTMFMRDLFIAIPVNLIWSGRIKILCGEEQFTIDLPPTKKLHK
jgi:hypothetical protein